MYKTTRKIELHKRIALVAHDSCKQSLLAWTKKHAEALKPHYTPLVQRVIYFLVKQAWKFTLY